MQGPAKSVPTGPRRSRSETSDRPARRWLHSQVDATSLDCLLLTDMDPSRAARMLLALKPPKIPEAPKVVAPSRFRKNHQAMTKPFQLPDGPFPCAKGCGRCFSHAPASVAHSKACKFVGA